MAVLDGFNVFPINMVGADHDFLLNINKDNCPAFGKELKQQYASVEGQNSETLLRISQLFGEEKTFDLPDGYEACKYLLWADLHSIELTLDYTEKDIDDCIAIMN